MKKHSGFIIFFSVVIAVFLWKIFSVKWGFLEGDYKDQFYPWSYIYSNALKNFTFPFWTKYVHSGFPLMAEGQVGGFYPLNIVFFAFLPFKFAYNYIIILHFILAGSFTYLYTRKIGACQWGGALAALLFCFGSAYAGCFYNTVTVKTLIWVPLVLYFFENYFDQKKPSLLIFAGIILGVQFLAGFAQMAVYSTFFYSIYFVTGLVSRKSLTFRDMSIAAGSFLLAAAIFYPQLRISMSLIEVSSRQNATMDFALWGSFSPLNFMSAVVPYWVFRGTRFYIGILSLLFLIVYIADAKKRVKSWPLLSMFLISFFLAIGKYNPFYVLFLKALNFYSFRNPSKFLFFGMFAASSMAGLGFTRFCFVKNEEQTAFVKIFSSFVGIMLGLFFIAKLILKIFGDKILEFGRWYVSNYIYGKAHHRFDLEVYMGKVASIYSALINSSSLGNPFVLFSVLMCMASVIIVVIFVRHRKSIKVFKLITLMLIFVDLYVFSFYGTGFRGNIKSYETLEPECKTLLETVKGDPGFYRILPFDIASGKLPNWALPSMNAVFAIDSAAMYSPLVSEIYRKALEGLEVIDNSLGLMSPSENILKENLDILKVLNVKYIVAPYAVDCPGCELVGEEDGIKLYSITGVYPRFFCGKQLDRIVPDKSVSVEVLEYTDGVGRFRVDIPYKGYFFLSEAYFKGWEVFVNGEEKGIIPVSLIQVVEIDKGQNVIEFRFSAGSS